MTDTAPGAGRPRIIRLASAAAFALAGLGLLAAAVLVYGLVTVRAPDSAPYGTLSSWLWIGSTALRFAVAAMIVFASLLVAGLWIWIGVAVGKGHGWSRVLAAVLLAASVLTALVLSVLIPDHGPVTGFALFTLIAAWLIALLAAALVAALMVPAASRFFSVARARRAAAVTGWYGGPPYRPYPPPGQRR